ncbi:MAG: TerC family protein [Rhizobiales bacterium]|nr:TerC family protein [Hyphomicrobiales bacterium]
MLELLADPQVWAALITLTVLEIVLGIDNLVFIAVLASRLDERNARLARQIGLSLALVFRIALLFTLTTLIAMQGTVFTILGNAISWRDIILIGGGLFLLGKATHEVHAEIEGDEEEKPRSVAAGAFWIVTLQIVLIDIVFSIDSILTAIGMSRDLPVMVAAVLIAVTVMYLASKPTSDFIARHPTTKMLALAFLMLIGVALIADGFEVHIPRGYIYFGMAFAGVVEFFNVLASRTRMRPAKRMLKSRPKPPP